MPRKPPCKLKGILSAHAGSLSVVNPTATPYPFHSTSEAGTVFTGWGPQRALPDPHSCSSFPTHTSCLGQLHQGPSALPALSQLPVSHRTDKKGDGALRALNSPINSSPELVLQYAGHMPSFNNCELISGYSPTRL